MCFAVWVVEGMGGGAWFFECLFFITFGSACFGTLEIKEPSGLGI